MLVRPYTDADFDALRAMHAAQNFGYALPDLNDPLFLVRLVVEDEPEAGTSGADTLVCAPSDENMPGKCAQAGVPAPLKPERHIRMAALLRLTAETYLLADPRDGTPRQRWNWLTALHEEACRAAVERGLADVQAFLPPPVARAFGRRLEKLGWRRDPWSCYTRWLP